MKKLFTVLCISLFAISLSNTSCRKPKVDPCEGIECPPGMHCEEGKCVEGRKR